nr:LexA family transcriptional regulator [Methylomonas sp. 11b]
MSSNKLTNHELSFASVISRAKESFSCKTDKALADAIGISPQVLVNRKNTDSIPYEELIDAAIEAGLDVGYILTNKRSVKPVREKTAEYTNGEYAEIPHFNVQAAAGPGKVAPIDEESRPLSFRRDWLKARGLSPANLAIVDVSGDSMEPYLKDEDLVLVDRAQTEISSGKTYVLRLDGHLLVKNLQLLPHGLVQVASFNAGFPPYQVDLSDESLDMAVIGRVVASMHEW